MNTIIIVVELAHLLKVRERVVADGLVDENQRY
jgi:5,10-methenyltetrahydromethanopterin hydrogenase